METLHPKSVRRRLLTILYENYQKAPLEMLGPKDFLGVDGITREVLAPNMHYLSDRGLVELMMGYRPQMFDAARITAQGIDLVENEFEFGLRFPPVPGDLEMAMAEAPMLVERLLAEADFSPLDGEARRSLLRDVQYLRDELARPARRWRLAVIRSVLDWMAEPFDDPDEILPSLRAIRTVVERDGLLQKEDV
jgi:hypothetical protein